MGVAVKRVWPNGKVTVVAETGGSPCGMAIGPDGWAYIANNGGLTFPPDHFTSIGPSKDYRGGYIQKLDVNTGKLVELCN